MQTFAEVKERVEALTAEGYPDYVIQRFFYNACKALPAEERINNLYRVKGKSGKAIPFRMNSQQILYWAKCALAHFTLILKSRQIGFTTFACVRAFDWILFSTGWRAGIMAHKKENVQEIFKIVRRLFEYFKKDYGHLMPITTRGDSRLELELVAVDLADGPIPLESSVKVSHDFKGYTLNSLHVSEAAFIDPTRVSENLQCVPHDGYVVYETTPNGMDEVFYRTYENIRKKKVNYVSFFAPWHEHYPEVGDALTDDDFAPPYTPRELELKKEYGVTDRALQWRRNKIAGELGDNIAEFERLYPSDDVECFLAGECKIFPQNLLKLVASKIRDPIFGEIVGKGSALKFEADESGRYLLWEEPIAGHQYVIGLDASEGVDKDATCAYVKDRESGHFCCSVYGKRLSVDEAAECAVRMAKYFNAAHICIEINGVGLAVLENVRKRGYTKLYHRREIDNTTNKLTKVVGFRTSRDSKVRIVQNLKAALSSGKAVIYDPLFLSEASTYIITKTGGYEAQSGKNDDTVMAAALAQEMDAALPEPQNDENYIDDTQYDEVTGMPI